MTDRDDLPPIFVTAPESIWLQPHIDHKDETWDGLELGDISWSDRPDFIPSIQYIRADIVQQMIESEVSIELDAEALKRSIEFALDTRTNS